jgi:aspartyl protease family protein
VSDDNANMLWLVGALVLALSALTARRLSFGAVIRSLLGWLVIGALAWLVITNRDGLERLFGEVSERAGIGTTEMQGDTVRITMSPDGHFWARVRLNGYTQRMLVDSGATITAISGETARNAGIEATNAGLPVLINTANGTISAQRGRADTVTLGTLETRDLGVVISPAFGNVNVLGMNYLSRLGSWRVEGRTLILEPKKPNIKA